MSNEKELKKINIEVEISGCSDCPFCKHKYNELTNDMKFHGIPNSVWICDKGAYGKLEKYTPQRMSDSLRNLFTDSKNLDGEYYTGESSRPDYPPYIGCPYFDVDKLSSFVTEVNNISIPNDGITTDEMITLMKKYGITIEDYKLPDDNDDSNTDNSGDTNEGTTTDPEDNTEDTPSDSGDNNSGNTDGSEDNNDTDISDEIIDPEVQPETEENETEEGELNV